MQPIVSQSSWRYVGTTTPLFPEGGSYTVKEYEPGRVVVLDLFGSPRPWSEVIFRQSFVPNEGTPKPVVVETVKRIVSGTHNGLQVNHVRGDDGVYITADAGLWDASKLRAGAAIMMQYADALDEGAR